MKGPPDAKVHEQQISIAEFRASYNQNMPERFPRVSLDLLKKFKETHAALFKNGDFWSLDLHRKRIMDWLPLNGDAPQ